MGEVLFGTTLLAAFLGGVVALLAPCCVSVMLPAYLATGFRHRGGVVPVTCVVNLLAVRAEGSRGGMVEAGGLLGAAVQAAVISPVTSFQVAKRDVISRR